VLKPRVRFAPSPTGYLHVGGARTALFNWLYARRHGGVFVLRIEDTDAARSTPESLEGILDGLRWLGLDWDEGPKIDGPYGPYFQSQRFDRHRKAADELLRKRFAYYCYCTPEELQAKREIAERETGGWLYDRTCSSLSSEEVAAREARGLPRATRFRVPAGVTRFDDLVRGPIEFDGANLEDFIIVRSDGLPTYNLSVVSDDVDMKITHVVRGDDHISNTPKQLMLYQALGAPVPQFAHVPLILGADKKRLSKRHGATSVMEYARQGYLPEALFNFLALLGWSPGKASGDREIFTAAELAEIFGLDGISGGNAVFNTEKLDWFNQQYILRLPPDQLALRVRPWLEAAGLWNESYLTLKHAWFFAVLELLRPRAKRLDEFASLGRFFFTDAIEYEDASVAKHLLSAGMAAHLEALGAALAGLAGFEPSSIEGTLRAVAEAGGVKAATLIHATRVAMTGRSVSPGLFEVVALLGRDRAAARIEAAVRLISSSHS
jgi:glutamyl-tRNA synthetase